MWQTEFAASDCLVTTYYEETDFDLEKKESPLSKRKRKSAANDTSSKICKFCNQNIADPGTKSFQGLVQGALEEEAALTDDRLQLYCEGELIPEIDNKPLHKITCFTVFDGEGHLCPFDTGLIEDDQLLFFSGYIKPIYDDDPTPKNGVPAQELGPIVEWWISGFDGGNSFLIAFRTPYAEYILMEPSSDYNSFMRAPKQKALLTKIVIEFLSNSSKPTYEDLLDRLNEVSVPEDIEPFDDLIICKNAQFIIDQVSEVDDKGKLMSTPAVQDIIKKFKVKATKIKSVKKKTRFKNPFKTITTPLVRQIFNFFFDAQAADNSPNSKVEKSKDLLSSSPRSKEVSKFSWEENSNQAVVNDEIVGVKDFVFIYTNHQDHEKKLFRIERFFRENFTDQVHCTELIKSTDTILGNAGHPSEFFFLEKCSSWPICKIMKKADVLIKTPPKIWADFLNTQPLFHKENQLFVQKKYSLVHGSFEDFEEIDGTTCMVCFGRQKNQKSKIPVYVPEETETPNLQLYKSVIFDDEEYFPGCCIFLEPFSVVFDAQKSSLRIEKTLVTIKTDEIIYPEMYRKSKELSLMEECPEPFVVAYVKSIFSRSEGLQRKLFLTVNKFYRPENTRVIEPWDERLFDLQLLYWSEEEAEVSFDYVRGRCDVIYSKIPREMSLKTQFYFNKGFDSESEIFYDCKEINIKNKERKSETFKKLKTLNVFSGCGGLANGISRSGVADIVWAVEIDKATAASFKLNFPEVRMFEKDCNLFLKEVLCGKSEDENENLYPIKGEVELLCGGPPCQGFSTMNRFSTKEESQYNNSLILNYLSFCDYYRPKFFLLENVKNFVSFKKSIFFRHAIGCLVAMGYQCCFGVLQAGNYGLPQSRRRLFILAAAPGYQLPNFPKPTHVFYGSLKNMECEVGGINYICKFSKDLSGSAPYRNVRIRDAIVDLPSILRESERKTYYSERTYFQKFLMGSPSKINDHVSKEMSAINEARIKHIPAAKGCDWRDLPNIRVRLRDGNLTDLLRYTHHDIKNGKSCCGLLRGVCTCASGLSCDSKSRQNNTLIPWFLVHTANRNNNWTGLYGRLDWEGVFNTVTTNPEPSSQQGKVLHPEEHRTISVRECARAQGLPDSFKLYGTSSDKFKQVGNAVPSPVARALGSEIKKCLLLE